MFYSLFEMGFIIFQVLFMDWIEIFIVLFCIYLTLTNLI